MGDLSGDAFKEGHHDYNRGHLIDPGSINLSEIGSCPESPDGKHWLEHFGQTDPEDMMSDPVVHCRKCGRLAHAKWKKEYAEGVEKHRSEMRGR